MENSKFDPALYEWCRKNCNYLFQKWSWTNILYENHHFNHADFVHVFYLHKSRITDHWSFIGFCVCKHKVTIVRSQVSPSLNILPVHTSIIFLSSNLIAISYLLKKKKSQYLIFLIHLNLKQTSKFDLLEQRWERRGANLTLSSRQNQNRSKKNPFLILKLKIIKS